MPGTSLRTVCLRQPQLPPHDVAVPGLVLVDREQGVDQRGDRRHRDRHHVPSKTPSIRAPGRSIDREGHQHPVQHQRRPAQGEDRQRQREAREDRPDQGVEEADQRRRCERVRGAIQDEAGQHLGEQQQGERVEQEDEHPPPHDAETHALRTRSGKALSVIGHESKPHELLSGCVELGSG